MAGRAAVKRSVRNAGAGESAGESLVPVGLRERNKLDKLNRIKDAAHHLFTTKGFDETTTREIAVLANVGMGTVFTYADNKRDLLFLIANEELERAIGKARRSVKEDSPLLENLIEVYRPHYTFFSAQPALSRLMLREMTFYDSGSQATQFHLIRENLLSLIREVVHLARKQHPIADNLPDHEIAWVLFCIYQVELRRWLATERSSVRSGLTSLRRSLGICIRGIGA